MVSRGSIDGTRHSLRDGEMRQISVKKPAPYRDRLHSALNQPIYLVPASFQAVARLAIP